jgi:hypothetical protein
MIDKDMRTVSFRQMHEMQVEALTDFIAMAINLASAVGDELLVDDVTDAADELVKMFGGNGVQVEVKIDV